MFNFEQMQKENWGGTAIIRIYLGFVFLLIFVENEFEFENVRRICSFMLVFDIYIFFLKVFFNAERKLLVCVCDSLTGGTQFCDCSFAFLLSSFSLLSVCVFGKGNGFLVKAC